VLVLNVSPSVPPSSNITSDNELHPLNGISPIRVTDFGIVIEDNFVLTNTSFAIDSSVSGRIIVLSPEFLKQLASIFYTCVLDKSICSNEVHPANIYHPILTKPFGIFTYVSDEQLANHPFYMSYVCGWDVTRCDGNSHLSKDVQPLNNFKFLFVLAGTAPILVKYLKPVASTISVFSTKAEYGE